MEGQDYLKGAINVRDPPGRGDQKFCREYTVATRTKIVSKSKRTIFKNRSPQDFAEKGFPCLDLVFLCFLSIFNPLCVLHDPLRPRF